VSQRFRPILASHNSSHVCQTSEQVLLPCSNHQRICILYQSTQRTTDSCRARDVARVFNEQSDQSSVTTIAECMTLLLNIVYAAMHEPREQHGKTREIKVVECWKVSYQCHNEVTTMTSCHRSTHLLSHHMLRPIPANTLINTVFSNEPWLCAVHVNVFDFKDYTVAYIFATPTFYANAVLFHCIILSRLYTRPSVYSAHRSIFTANSQSR